MITSRENVEQKIGKRRNIILTIIFYAFPFFHYTGFFYVGFNTSFVKSIHIVLLAILALIASNYWIRKGTHIPFYTNMRLIVISTLLSIIMAKLFWSQEFYLSLISTGGILGILFYFYMIKIKPTMIEIERLIIFYSVIFSLAWLYGFYKAPELVFGDTEAAVDDTRGLIRLRLPGVEGVVLLVFYLFNKFSISKKRLYLLLGVIALVVITVQLTRQVLVFSLLIGFGYLLRSNIKAIVIFIILVVTVALTPINFNFAEGTVFGSLINLTQSQVQQQKVGENDIRVEAFKFFLSDFSKNPITDLFGNGIPHPKSEYGNYYVKTINEQKSFFMSDVGYAHIFVIYGLFGLLCYFHLFFKVIISKLPEELDYVKMYFLYLVFVNIASVPYTNMVILSVCVYLISRYKNKQNLNTSA